jgi:hypothetical protein
MLKATIRDICMPKFLLLANFSVMRVSKNLILGFIKTGVISDRSGQKVES